MGLARGKASAQGVHPVVQAMGLTNVLEQLPVTVMITDANGAFVFRNHAGLLQLQELIRAHGERVVDELRTGMMRVARDQAAFPATGRTQAVSNGRTISIDVFVNKLPEGYLFSWRDATVLVERTEALQNTSQELSQASQRFEELSRRFSADNAEVAAQADAVAAGAEQFSASIQNISASASKAVTETGKAVAAAGGASERIAKLGDSSAQIESVSKLINAIAEQTNLLALNATIEAARAGEAGKGFAVVAGEVKELASRTSAATGQIAATIQAIQSDSVSVAASISEIVGVIGQIEAEQTTIASAVEEQSATAVEISSNVTAVATAAQSSTQAVADLHAASVEMSGKSQTLRSLI